MRKSHKLDTKRMSKANKRIRKGDKVFVFAGNSRGMSGIVLSRTAQRAVIQGLNVRKRHVKGQGERKGEIVSVECPINISNLQLCSKESDQPVKLRVRLDEQGQRQLHYVDGSDVLHRAVKKS